MASIRVRKGAGASTIGWWYTMALNTNNSVVKSKGNGQAKDNRSLRFFFLSPSPPGRLRSRDELFNEIISRKHVWLRSLSWIFHIKWVIHSSCFHFGPSRCNLMPDPGRCLAGLREKRTRPANGFYCLNWTWPCSQYFSIDHLVKTREVYEPRTNLSLFREGFLGEARDHCLAWRTSGASRQWRRKRASPASLTMNPRKRHPRRNPRELVICFFAMKLA